jgi:hypothetical protein
MMHTSPQLIERLAQLVHLRNRELASDAILKTGLGVVFSFVTFGLLFWLSWFVGFFVAHYLHLQAWQFGAILTGLFFVVATWSAWRRVDPLAGLKPLTDQQMLLTLIGQATGAFVYFSPRRATAGAAIVLIGGPANVFEAFGIWAHRIRADAELIDQAARLLALCQAELPAEEVRAPAAAFLLRRLALIKIVLRGDSAALALTDKGSAVISKSKSRSARAT